MQHRIIQLHAATDGILRESSLRGLPLHHIDIDTDSAPTVPLTATRVAFNIESLVDYLLASGNFRDPVSRIPFTMTDLGEIDELVSLIV